MLKVYTGETIEKAIEKADAVAYHACISASHGRFENPEALKVVADSQITAMRIYQDTLRAILGLRGFKETTNKDEEEHD